MNIGYIGLGALGGALARRLLPAHELTVWDVNARACAPFAQLGAAVAADAVAVARGCEVVVLCLPRSSDVRQAIFGADGLAHGLSRGQLVIDQTSGDPDETREMAQRLAALGVDMLDVAVSGNSMVVAAGQATLMVGGSDRLFERARPVLEAIGTKIHRCGGNVGDGQAMKSVNNALNAACRLGTLEVLALARKAGLPLQVMYEVLNRTSAKNRCTERMLPALIDGRESTNFALALQLKDGDQALALGVKADMPMLITTVTRSLLQAGVNTVGPSARLEDIVGVIASMAGTHLTGPHAEGLPVAPHADVRDDLCVGMACLSSIDVALARRVKSSRRVIVFDADAKAVQSLVREGFEAAADLRSLARACDVVFVGVEHAGGAADIMLGDNGLASGLASGKIVVDLGGGDPAQTRGMAAYLQQQGVALVDAPLLDATRDPAAVPSVACGGSAEAVTTVRAILLQAGAEVMYCGGAGSGHLAKVLNDAVAACNRLATYECVGTGLKYGLKLADMDKAINSGSGWNGASERLLPALGRGATAGGAPLATEVAGLRRAAALAVDHGAPMSIFGAVRSLVEAGANRLGDAAGVDALARFFEESGGFRFGDHVPNIETSTIV